MYWLDNTTGVAAPPTIPPVVSPTKLYFTEGGGGEQPSIPGAEWFNMITDELLQVLSLAGISPDKADHTQLAKAIQSIAFSAYPVGSPIPWPTAVPPDGFIAMIGQSFSPSTYPRLAQAYPGLVLPDLRAESIRGWDAGRGIDAGRALLSLQLDALQNITGGYNDITGGANTGSGSGVFSITTLTPNLQPLPTGGNYKQVNISFDASRVARTAAETRIRTLAFYYIVRAE